MPAARLPDHVRPKRYDVHLHAAVGRDAFHGEVRIQIGLARAVDAIKLHARALDVTDAVATCEGREFAARSVKMLGADEMVELSFLEPLPPGEATLQISFRGQVNKGMRGLYLSTDGAEACLATQCEEAEARAIFPCFDEPAFKARFAWTVTTSPDVIVLANGPALRVERAEGEATWVFGETPPMSSYLAALTIGKLAATPERIVGGTPLRVWAMEGKQEFGEFGNDLAARLLPWYEAYFAQPYPFHKYDQVAVPSFSAGAMENSGLVLFRASLLLRDPRTTSWRQEKAISRVIAHEMAHMWFGNLVTMQWWDDIWLNESFAEWIANRSVDELRPSDHTWDDFHADKRRAQAIDALASSHAIYAPVESVHDVTELFDAITYEKGAAVMRMLEGFLGEEVFRAGLRSYMAEFAFKNARGEDLWRHLERASGRPVSKLMASWILQPGFPTVAADLEGTTLRLSQQRFFWAHDAKAPDQTWLVPLVIRYADDAGTHEVRHLLEAREGQVALPAKGHIRYVQVNADALGYYRRSPSPALTRALTAHLKDLTGPEQMDLIEDAWGHARAGGPLEPVLDLLGPLMRDARSHAVLALAAERLASIEDILAADARALDAFRAFVREGLAKEAARLGPRARPGESHDDAERRAIVMEALAARGRDEGAIRELVAHADLELRDPHAADPTLAGPAVRIALKFGGEARLETHLRAYDERRNAKAAPAATDRYLYSFPAASDAAVVTRILEKEREGFFPLQAVGPLLRAMFWEPDAREMAWKHLKTDWVRLRAGLGDQWMAFLIDAAGRLPGRLRPEMEAFFETALGDVAKQSRARALESVAQRAEFEARAGPEAVAWALSLK